MARSYLVLDIETVPDPALYPVADGSIGHGPGPGPGPGHGHGQGPGAHAAPGIAVVERPFPPVHVHRPIVIGALWLDEEYRFRRLGVIGEGKDEKGMLEAFSAFVSRYQPDLVTYNGRSFDLPVLALRSLRHGIAMSWYYRGRLRHRYTEEGHLDLCDMLSDHGACRSISLDAVARLIGLPGKVGVDGSQVEGLYRAGKLDAIKSYCLADVAQTGLLFLRFRVLQGAMTPAAYRINAGKLMESLRADPRLEDVISQIDGDRLLLAAA